MGGLTGRGFNLNAVSQKRDDATRDLLQAAPGKKESSIESCHCAIQEVCTRWRFQGGVRNFGRVFTVTDINSLRLF